MDPQNTSNYLYQHGSNRRGFSGQNTSRWEDTATSRTAAFGGTGMMLSYSNQSSNSASSGHSAATNLSAPASIPFSTTMSSYDQQLPMFDYGQSYSPALSFASLPASMLNYGSLDQTTIACPQRYERERRETPSTLGWAPDYVPLSAYIFIVPKGEEPYWRLQPHHPVTDKTPERVYLDPPRRVYPDFDITVIIIIMLTMAETFQRANTRASILVVLTPRNYSRGRPTLSGIILCMRLRSRGSTINAIIRDAREQKTLSHGRTITEIT